MKNLLILPMAALLAGAFSVAQAATTTCTDSPKQYGPITIQKAGSKCVAVIDADGEHRNELVEITTTEIVDSVYYFRSNSGHNTKQTAILPIRPSSGCLPTTKGANFSKITKIAPNSKGIWTISSNVVTTSKDGFQANYPYLVEFSERSGNTVGFSFGGANCSFDLNTTEIKDSVEFSANPDPSKSTGLTGSWKFKGVYQPKSWAEGDSERGYVYGFVGQKDNTQKINIGQFIKAGANATLPSLRAYLVYDKNKGLAKARAIASSDDFPMVANIPENIDVDEDNECFREGDEIFVVKNVLVRDVEGNPVLDENGDKKYVKTACIDGKSEARLQTLDIPEDVVVDSIAYNREFAQQKATTVMFPFAISPNNVSTAVFYKTVAIVKYCPQCEWTLEVNKLLSTDTLEANKPYIAWTGSSTLSFNTARYNAELNKIIRSITLSTKGPLSYNFESTITSNGNIQTANWSFVGTYSKITFNDENKKGIYGFAANAQGSSIQPGQFVKAGTGATVPPMRAYLKYNAASALAKAAAGTEIAEENLPETITVKFIDGDGSTLSIGQMNTITGEISMDENKWFDMKGRVLNKKPTVKGTYYNKGQKVIIK